MIDTKALRSRVLDLAIQGKLTEQLESDGTAEELWQQIQAEKQRLIKVGKLKKEKPLPEISEEDIVEEEETDDPKDQSKPAKETGELSLF